MAILDHIKLDFQILNTGDPKLLIVMDTSVWGFIEDKPSIIEILSILFPSLQPKNSNINKANFKVYFIVISAWLIVYNFYYSNFCRRHTVKII